MRAEAPVPIAAEYQPAAGRHQRGRAGPLLVGPGRLAGLRRNGVDRAHPVGAGRDLVAPGQRVQGLVRVRHQPRARVAQREVHQPGQGAVGARLPVLAARGERRADQHFLALPPEDQFAVLRHHAGGAVDVADHILRDGRIGPQELAGLAVEGVDDAGLARNAGHHFAHFTGLESRVDPAHRARVGRHRRVEQDPLERMVEIPVVVQVLVVPGDLAGVGVERERRVVVEVGLVGAAEHELRCGRTHGRADVHQVQLRVVARHHPGPDVRALFVRHVAPGLVPRFAGCGYQWPAPQLRAARRVVRHDEAGVRAAGRQAAAPRHDLAARDDRTGGLVGRVLRVVDDLRLPGQAARRGVHRVRVAVGAGADQ